MQHPTIMYSPAKPEGPWLGSLRACLGQQSNCRRSTQSPVRALPADHQATNKIKLPRRSLALAMTGLAALAPSACLAASRKGSKRKGLSIKELMDITADDVGRKKSLVTGQVDQSVYDDQLDFGDPSVKQIGLEKYVKGVSTLFDPASEVDLISIKQVDDTTFKTRWRLGARVNFPFKLTLKPYLGGSTYKVNQDHLIQSQTDEFDIPGWDLVLSGFLPWSIGAPPAPPVS